MKNFMDKTTFTEVYSFLKKQNNDNLMDCFSNVFGIGLLFLPGLMCKDVAMITNLANGVTLLGAKDIIEKSVKSIIDFFKKQHYKDFSTKYEHMQIAQVLITYSAYFDAIKIYLPDKQGYISLSANEKYKITQESIDEYIKELEKASQDVTAEILKQNCSLPLNDFDKYKEELNRFYEILNNNFMKFYEKLSFFESLSEPEKERFIATIRELPINAVDNYKKQFYELATCFNDFYIWLDFQERAKRSKQIDVGFKVISNLIDTYEEKCTEKRVEELFKGYERKYKAYVEDAVIKIDEMEYESMESIIFPAKQDIFVPQQFQVLSYKKEIPLEKEEVWENVEKKENIGIFISSVLRHPMSSNTPLLILGLPGAGKSLLCSMLAAQILSHEYHVIIIKLRDIIADDTIKNQVNQQIRKDFGDKCSWDDIVSSHISKPILLIFDGYDELLQASGRTYSNYLRTVAEFQTEQAKIHDVFIRCIVTSRTILIDKAFIPHNSTIIKLCDFDDSRIEEWSRIWNSTNDVFFEKNNVQPFLIEKESKVYELAKQPLLLLMLALYDSNNNELRNQKDLNVTQLYNNLIQEFISREKRKDISYKNQTKPEQIKIIEAELNKISIAALGMYNRKVLYISESQLGEDINFLRKESDKKYKYEDDELTESAALLGSFFFIHKSDSTDVVEKETVKNAAYEFLHNTFGEFLTANFIMGEVFRAVNTISIMLDNNLDITWDSILTKQWYVCFLYSPLFSRPVVMNMLNELSDSYFIKRSVTTEKVDKALNLLITSEMNEIMSGDIMIRIKNHIDNKENCFQPSEILNHMAIYSLNIVLLRTVLCNKQYTLNLDKVNDKNVWNKLIHIWRYAFSEDDLIKLSTLFKAERKENNYLLSYNPSEVRFYHKDKMLNLYNISSTIADEIQQSIIGSMLGNSQDFGVIVNTIEKEKLRIKSQYMMTLFIEQLIYGHKENEDICATLERLSSVIFDEMNVIYIFIYYLLVNYLCANKMLPMNRMSQELLLRNIRIGYSFFPPFHLHKTGKNKLFILLDSMIWNMIEYIDMPEDILSDILHYNIGDYHYNNTISSSYNLLRFFNKNLKKFSRNGKNRIIKDYIYYLKNIVRSNIRSCKVTTKYLVELLEFCKNLLKIKEIDCGMMIYDIIRGLLEENDYQLTKSQSGILVDFLTSFYKVTKDSERIYDILKRVNADMSIKNLYRYSSESVFNLLYLISEEVIGLSEKNMFELILIIKEHSQDMSYKMYKIILKITAKYGDERLEECIRQFFD